MPWVTAGYTVENYVPEHLLTAAIYAARPSTKKRTFAGQSQGSDPLMPDRLGLNQPSKVAISKVVTQDLGDQCPDLKKKVQAVIRLISVANSHT